MANLGLEFTMKDGTKEYFDPVNYPDDFRASSTDYKFELSNGHTYTFEKTDVKSYRTYELCEGCGYEVEKQGFCEDCQTKNDNFNNCEGRGI